jgi:hypothetical protein
MESRKIFEQLLMEFGQTSSPSRLRAGVEAAHGLMNTFMQQTVVNLVQLVLPDVEGRDLFPDFLSRLDQSIRLREDLWIFHEVVGHAGRKLDASDDDALARRVAYQGLAEYVVLFESQSFRYVRAADHEPFEGFFATVRSLKNEPFTNPTRSREIANNFERFRIFLEATLAQVNNRIDLQNVPLDTTHARRIVEQFTREV